MQLPHQPELTNFKLYIDRFHKSNCHPPVPPKCGFVTLRYAMKKKKTTKKPSRKHPIGKVSQYGIWTVLHGKLVPNRGRPRKVNSIFKVVAEKIPWACLAEVENDMQERGLPKSGIYIAHDSMGVPRYVGRGDIFGRLRARKNVHEAELHYFSYYIVLDKKNEREIETLVIRATSPLLDFNERKKRTIISTGNIRDYEGGTFFYERQKKRGRASSG
jgi:hypothetical protein